MSGTKARKYLKENIETSTAGLSLNGSTGAITGDPTNESVGESTSYSFTVRATANTKTMSAGTAFTTSVSGEDYQFVTIADITSSNTGSSVPFDSVNIYEGS